MADERRIGPDEVARHFEALEDPRSSINRKHPLVSVVVIALMAVLAGANGPTAIAKWAALKEEFLLAALDLPEGVPGKDVFRRVLMALRPGAFRACFVTWLESLRAEAVAATGVEQPVLAVDGMIPIGKSEPLPIVSREPPGRSSMLASRSEAHV
jgi:DDE_Tnp_1-associated